MANREQIEAFMRGFPPQGQILEVRRRWGVILIFVVLAVAGIAI